MKTVLAIIFSLLCFLLSSAPAWGKTVIVRYIILTPDSQKLSQTTGQPALREPDSGGAAKATSPQHSGETIPPESEIEIKIKQFFGKYSHTAKAIAMCESHLNPQAVGDGGIAYWQNGIEYGRSWGIFQIRYLPGRPHPTKLLNPDYNIAYAYQLFVRSGYAFTAWSCYTNGGYLAYL